MFREIKRNEKINERIIEEEIEDFNNFKEIKPEVMTYNESKDFWNNLFNGAE